MPLAPATYSLVKGATASRILTGRRLILATRRVVSRAKGVTQDQSLRLTYRVTTYVSRYVVGPLADIKWVSASVGLLGHSRRIAFGALSNPGCLSTGKSIVSATDIDLSQSGCAEDRQYGLEEARMLRRLMAVIADRVIEWTQSARFVAGRR
jgi:hypothetical protein